MGMWNTATHGQFACAECRVLACEQCVVQCVMGQVDRPPTALHDSWNREKRGNTSLTLFLLPPSHAVTTERLMTRSRDVACGSVSAVA
jgi:hypothetical protein